MQLVIVCACWMLKIRMSQRFATTLHWILHTFIISFISYWAIISPHSPVPSQRTHPHKQVCIAAENICSLYLRRSISRLWDQSSWLIKCSSWVNIHECPKHVLKEKRTMSSDCQWIVEALFDQCCKFKAQESDFRLTTLDSPGASYQWSEDARCFLPPELLSHQPREVSVEL